MWYGARMELLTVGDVARELGMTPAGVRRRVERGDMRAEVQTPRLWLISRAEVDRAKVLGALPRGPKPRLPSPP